MTTTYSLCGNVGDGNYLLCEDESELSLVENIDEIRSILRDNS